ncbi:aspartyl-tRNA(Asn)/glutamyl-tRNA(Gln) amidotransferase subunit A [Deinobacterium chartae]|uniref:Aspartyl-tRNA(Asn)/glutamyl-tRNA(Gln) amidotransferase subunit A n=1 Tax=Deinobacterium chartae TaxID=521158 RepID=A0A841HXI0_9DEIO|nr:amidase [Deinobacterium chartae]MBB6096949.1 aspartyl-tRNA(Asn)/glutamyl-tRNA(Gln) amidotransferase subunit A [Deinobacterium chartae]
MFQRLRRRVTSFPTPSSGVLEGLPLELTAWSLDRPLLRHWAARALRRRWGLTGLFAEAPGAETALGPAREHAPDGQVAYRTFAGRSQATALRERYLLGKTTPLEVAEVLLAQTAAWASHGFLPLVSLDPEALLEAAAASSLRYAQGRSLGPLDGIPVAIADTLTVEGLGGMEERLRGRVSEARDADVVARLRGAGALIVGKAQAQELGLGSSGIHPRTPLLHPYDVRRLPGGAQGGAAAVVASGLVPLAVASDSGTSARRPAALCGAVALKPGTGQVSRAGLLPLAPAFDTVAFIADSVTDAALLLEACAKHPPEASVASGGVIGVRIGYFPGLLDQAEPAARAAFERGLGHLRSQGARLVPLEAPYARQVPVITVANLLLEAAEQYGDLLRARELSALPAETRVLLHLGASLSGSERRRLRELTGRVRRVATALFDRADVHAMPHPRSAQVASRVARQRGHLDPALSLRGTYLEMLACLLGLPALNLPSGQDELGLPLSVGLMSAAHGESLLLRVAAALELPQLPGPPRFYAGMY